MSMTAKLRASAFHEAGHFVGNCIVGGAIPQCIEVDPLEGAAYSGRVATAPGARALLSRDGLMPDERRGEAMGVCRAYAAGRVAEEKAAPNDDWGVMLAESGGSTTKRTCEKLCKLTCCPSVVCPKKPPTK